MGPPVPGGALDGTRALGGVASPLAEFPAIDELNSLVEALAAERLSLSPPGLPAAPSNGCPRVLISHRRADAAPARRIAELATLNGFQFWLDVYDPSLRRLEAAGARINDEQRAALTAATIEMGLLNCTHVLAVLTSAAPGSAWIPYEYGRVKLPTVFSPQAACWIQPSYHAQLAKHAGNVPEYFTLGDLMSDQAGIVAWFRRFARSVGDTERDWPGEPTSPLPH